MNEITSVPTTAAKDPNGPMVTTDAGFVVKPDSLLMRSICNGDNPAAFADRGRYIINGATPASITTAVPEWAAASKTTDGTVTIHDGPTEPVAGTGWTICRSRVDTVEDGVWTCCEDELVIRAGESESFILPLAVASDLSNALAIAAEPAVDVIKIDAWFETHPDWGNEPVADMARTFSGSELTVLFARMARTELVSL